MRFDNQLDLFSDNLISNNDNLNQSNLTVVNQTLQDVIKQNLPFLHLLNQQYKWQFWMMPRNLISNQWIKNLGLNNDRILSLNSNKAMNDVDLIIKALHAKTGSYIVAGLSRLLTAQEKDELQLAVKQSGTYLLLIDMSTLEQTHFSTISISLNELC